jgi:hypothetical protein
MLFCRCLFSLIPGVSRSEDDISRVRCRSYTVECNIFVNLIHSSFFHNSVIKFKTQFIIKFKFQSVLFI